jgi:hypothetical protein
MKVFRFMSTEEFEKYRSGKNLKNKTNHKKQNHRMTTSVGFCFLSLDDFEPEYAYKFLSGIITDDVCVVFEVDEKKLKQSEARYNKPLTDEEDEKEMEKLNLNGGFFDFLISTLQVMKDLNSNGCMMAKEYCCTKYNNKDFKLIKYAEPVFRQKFEWKGEE